MKDLEDYDKEAWRWVVNSPKREHWVKAFFPIHVLSNMLCYNLCELFNSFILEVYYFNCRVYKTVGYAINSN